MVSDSSKVMVTPSFRFPYHCAGVKHYQWIIYISSRARSRANSISKIYWEISVFEYSLIITSQGTHAQHNKMICHVQT